VLRFIKGGIRLTASQDLAMSELDRVRRKYREERDKRLEAVRGARSLSPAEAARFLADPFSASFEREPRRIEVDVAVVGAGFGGLAAAAELKSHGVTDVWLVDRAGDVGGTWYWNRYPGAMCDVESYVYLPMLEELGYVPEHKYSFQPEILRYAQAIAARYSLYEQSLFQTAVTDVRWDEQAGRWEVNTDRGDELWARFVVIANGPLCAPRVPAISGIGSFRGKIFHASRWDYGYTGGDSHSDMTMLADRTVGLIGTGATGVQCLSPLAQSGRDVYVFQRTPSTVAVRDNRRTDQAWAARLTPGWQRERVRNFASIISGDRVQSDLVADGWTDLYREALVGPAAGGADSVQRRQALEMADYRRMEAVRARVDAVVKDATTAEKLKPYYRYMCKRPCFHDEYLEAFNRDNVHLIDTDGQGVEAIYEEGIVANGVRYPLDCIILATGFETAAAGASPRERWGYDVTGRGGITLTEKWADGMSTLHGLMSRGFPNFFVMPTRFEQSSVVVNFVYTSTENAKHLAYIVSTVRERGARLFDVAEDAEVAWVKRIVEGSTLDLEFLEGCTPGRNNREGRPAAIPRENQNYPGGPVRLFDRLEAWQTDGGLVGLCLEFA
jgi:cyclohexanone monooxygenase